MSWALAVIALILVGYAVGVRRLSAVNVSAAMFFTTAGLLAGPVLGVLDLHLHGEAVKLLAETTLVLVLFSDASRISPRALRRGAAVPVRLLGIGLPLTIAAGAAVGVLVLPGLSGVEALILAVMLACTDAALGQAVVTDERLPSRIRQGLNVESGLNDGLCVPIFLIAIGFAEADEGSMSGRHALRIVGEQLGFGLVAGVVAGLLGVLALRAALHPERREAGWLQILPASTAAAAAGGASALGGSIFIAAFTAGLVFAWQHRVSRVEAAPVTYLVDETGELLNAVTFVVFGAVILGDALAHLTWHVLLYAVLSLTVVRMIPVAAAMLGTRSRPATLLYLGWFGPRGLASIVFGVILLDDTSLAGQSEMLLAVAITVGLSVYAHGLTAGPMTERYVRWSGTRPDAVAEEAPGDVSADVRPRWHRPVPPAGG
ncbi:cation:proton antiporter [Nocardioides panacihumi]|uniref:Cation:proton antiporter n=1 Tax=Nocardioides panacihumi TaxID=400774 RepID=A0ABP5D8G0_9ACTN